MDNIFTKNEKEFAEAIFNMEQEAMRMSREEFTPNKNAMMMLLTVFRYIKKQNRNYWTIANMIRQLAFVVNTGEYKYLYGEWIVPDMLFRHLKNRKSEKALKIVRDIQYAGKWMEHYFFAYEMQQNGRKRQEHKKDNRLPFGGDSPEEKVKREISRLNLSVNMWIDIRMNEIELERKEEEEATEKAATQKEEILEEKDIQRFPMRLYQHLDKYVVGQDNLKKALTMSVYHYMKNGDRNPLLIIGPTGSGKNYIMETLAKFEEIDKELVVHTYDASSITMNGYKGNDINDIFSGFAKICRAKGRPAAKGIIFLDEIDKIIAPNTDGNGENVNAMIQHQLLSAIAGTTTISGVNTKDILFVLGGAFSKLEEMEKEKNKKTSFGFGNGKDGYDIVTEGDGTLRENLITYGAQKEFLGRISNIVRIERLNQNELKKILTHEETSILNKKKQDYLEDGLVLEFEEDVIDLIAEKVYKENLGARSAKNIVEALLGSYDFDMLMNGYTKMTVHAGMLAGEAPIFSKEVISVQEEASKNIEANETKKVQKAS